MAQFNQVLGQTEKTSLEEISHYYPNITESQTVQYIVNPNDQQLQGQQILVSTDQLMVIENQAQVILDPSQVTYQQTQQYIVHDAVVENRTQQQQVYYMKEEIAAPKQIQQQQQQPQQQSQQQQSSQPNQPIVLNHLQSAQLKTQMANSPQKATITLQQTQTRQMPPPPVRQIQSQINQSRQIAQNRQMTQPNSLNQQRVPQQQSQQSKPMVQNQASRPLTHTLPQREADNQDVITLADGTAVTVAEYKQILIEKKKNALGVQEKSETFLEPASPKKKTGRNSRAKGNANPRPARGGIRNQVGRGSIHNTGNVQLEYKVQNNLEEAPVRHQQFTNQQQQPLRNVSHPTNQQFMRNVNQTKQNQQALMKGVNHHPQQPLMKGMGQQQSQQQHINKMNPQQPHFMQQQQQQQQQTTQHLPQGSYTIQQQNAQNIQQAQQQQIHQQQQQLQQQMQQQQQLQQQQLQTQPTYMQPQYIIQPPSQRPPQQVCPLPSYVPSSQIQQIIENTPVSEEYNDSIRMLVLLENGEQRLITFTLPRETCTIQEILEQVGVPFHSETKIELRETNSNGINYFVTVGNYDFHRLHGQEVQEEPMETEEVADQTKNEPEVPDVVRTPSPEPPKEAPKFIPGKCAVCTYCGYVSEDFNRCMRCKHKFPDDVKSISVNNTSAKGDIQPSQQSQHQQPQQQVAAKKENEPSQANSPSSTTINSKNNIAVKKKTKSKPVEQEPVILTLSSDDEDDKSVNKSPPVTEHLLRRLSESSVSLSTIRKEPSASDIEKNSQEKQGLKGNNNMGDVPEITTEVNCRTMRIGSYRFVPAENRLTVKTSGISFKVPSPKDQNDIKIITIEKDGIVKILASFQKAMPVLFYYCSPTAAKAIRDELGMTKDGDYYFDPLSEEEAYKRITILISTVSEEMRVNLRKIYSTPFNIMDELTSAEANELLCKTCPKEISSVIASAGYLEIKQLLIYPPGKGGLPINTEDYLCLGQDQFLNDVIIDFYLKYLLLNLPKEKQEKVHIFSTFFYKRLTTKPVKATRKSHPSEHDPNLTPAQKRHARVEKWTKSVNLFEKDFIIIPINENCHWFLAIVCFPALTGCCTFDGKPVKLEPKKKKKEKDVENNEISAVKTKKEDNPIPCDDLEASDKDEAEGDESELESEDDGDSEEIENEKDNGQPIKQPCILIFDSLAGTGRSRVVATLRDYLTCEHKAKMGSERSYTKDIIKGACPKVPQQTNFTDCGLYLLQYVEQFFVDPIKDYRMPIKQLKNWFDEIIVTKKREDIANLIKELMIEYKKDPSVLPDITLPTRNGKLVTPEHIDEAEDEEDFEEEEEEEEDDDLDDEDLEEFRLELESRCARLEKKIDEPEEKIDDGDTIFSDEEFSPKESPKMSPKVSPKVSPKASRGRPRSDNRFKQQTVLNPNSLKPDLSEVSKPSNRDTLSYLKAKRINRHKNSDHSDSKKFKASE